MSFIPYTSSLATSVNHVSLCNIEGSPGQTINTQITLTGNEDITRTGYWEVYYKKTDGDSEMMDISSWITIEPKEFRISKDEIKTFKISIKIPGDASHGLWGATTNQAGQTGHSEERRTYILFKDTPEGGNVYSGLLIPISVQVIGKSSPFIPVLNFFKENLVVVILVSIIVVLGILLLVKTRHPKKA
jgi:hypothetical protein